MLRNDGFMSSAMDTARTDVSGLDEWKVFFSPDFGLAMEAIQRSQYLENRRFDLSITQSYKTGKWEN